MCSTHISPVEISELIERTTRHTDLKILRRQILRISNKINLPFLSHAYHLGIDEIEQASQSVRELSEKRPQHVRNLL